MSCCDDTQGDNNCQSQLSFFCILYGFNATCFGSKGSHHQTYKTRKILLCKLHNIILHYPCIWFRSHLHKYHKLKPVSVKNYVICSKCDRIRSKILLCNLHSGHFSALLAWSWLLVDPKHVALKPCSMQKELSCDGRLLSTWEQKKT
jgi:hypothetical protein